MPFTENIWLSPTNSPNSTVVAINSLNTAVNTPENTAALINLKTFTYMRQLSAVEEVFGQDSYEDSDYLYINLANYADIDLSTISGTGLFYCILRLISNKLQYRFIDFTKVGEYNSDNNLISEFIFRIGKKAKDNSSSGKLKPSDL